MDDKIVDSQSKSSLPAAKVLNNRPLIFFLFFFLAFISYFYVLNGDFIGDDIGRIIESPDFISSGLTSLWQTLTGELRDRPFLMTSIWLDKTLFGFNPFIMRVENLLLLAGIGLQLYSLQIELLSREKSSDKVIALLLAILFVVHPLHSQSVTTIIQRGILFSSLFALLSTRHFLQYVSNADHPRFDKKIFTTFFFLLLGLLSKPNIIFLPLLFLAYGFSFHYKAKEKMKWLLVLCFASLLVPAYFYFISKANVQHGHMTVSPLAYFLTQTQVLFVYLKLILVPYGLKFAYDFIPPSNLIYNVFWFYFLAHIALYCGVIFRLKDTRLRFWFSAIYFAFLPESGFFPIMHLAFEHRTFLPMIFMVIFLSQLLSKLDSNYIKRLTVFSVILTIAFIGLNQIRNHQIKNVNLWKLHTLQNSNTTHAVNFKFSVELMEAGYFSELNPILENYNHLYKGVPLYGLLNDFFSYFKDGEKKEDAEKIANWLASMELPTNQRQYINFFILKSLGKMKRGLEDQLQLETIFSRQQKIFFADKEAYQIFIHYYKTTTPTLVSQLKNNKAYEIQVLKMRAILNFYYGEKDINLSEDIQKALSKMPENKILLRLKELTEQSLKH